MRLRRKSTDPSVPIERTPEPVAWAAAPVVTAVALDDPPAPNGQLMATIEPSPVGAPVDIVWPDPGKAPRASRGPPSPGQGSRVGERLLATGIITPEQLDLALTEQIASGLRLGDQLVQGGTITERQLIEALALSERQLVETLAEHLHLPVVDLRQTLPTAEAVAQLPEALARRYGVVPLRMTTAGLELAAADLLGDTESVLVEGAGCPIVQVLAPPSEIRYAIDQAYLALAGVDQQVRVFESTASSRPVDESNRLVVDAAAPIVQVVMLLLTQAVRDRASDIHIEPKSGGVRVRFRIDGVLRDATELPDSMAEAVVSRIKVMADMNIVERRRSQDGQIRTMVDDHPLDIRVATTATIWGENAVLRLLDTGDSMRHLSDLGMTLKTRTVFRNFVSSEFGMVICAGPTGSGKTTTLYAALNEIDTPERNIVTIEDPVEYVLPSINQIQVNPQAGVTFAGGLRVILRQDPDVILVGEIRDVETARIAVQSSLTGHLVLSSLHATDSVTALQRLRDMGIEPFLITSSLLAIEAQRLVRRICPHCREPYAPSVAEQVFFDQNSGFDRSTRDAHEFWHGAGCNLCSQTGYASRVGIYELLPMTEPIKRLVMDDAGHSVLRELAIDEGMSTLADEAMRLVVDDVTTIAEAIRIVSVR